MCRSEVRSIPFVEAPDRRPYSRSMHTCRSLALSGDPERAYLALFCQWTRLCSGLCFGGQAVFGRSAGSLERVHKVFLAYCAMCCQAWVMLRKPRSPMGIEMLFLPSVGSGARLASQTMASTLAPAFDPLPNTLLLLSFIDPRVPLPAQPK